MTKRSAVDQLPVAVAVVQEHSATVTAFGRTRECSALTVDALETEVMTMLLDLVGETDGRELLVRIEGEEPSEFVLDADGNTRPARTASGEPTTVPRTATPTVAGHRSAGLGLHRLVLIGGGAAGAVAALVIGLVLFTGGPDDSGVSQASTPTSAEPTPSLNSTAPPTPGSSTPVSSTEASTSPESAPPPVEATLDLQVTARPKAGVVMLRITGAAGAELAPLHLVLTRNGQVVDEATRSLKVAGSGALVATGRLRALDAGLHSWRVEAGGQILTGEVKIPRAEPSTAPSTLATDSGGSTGGSQGSGSTGSSSAGNGSAGSSSGGGSSGGPRQPVRETKPKPVRPKDIKPKPVKPKSK